ncbi:MAG: COR domain-containing protein [Acidobacteriota bacterium]|nr:COR domain-containing protein [Acidobacteriota bacterium]
MTKNDTLQTFQELIRAESQGILRGPAIERCVRKLDAIKSLDLSDAHLSFLPAAVGKLASLESLNVSENAIGTLPSAVFDLSNLQELRCNGCDLTEISSDLSRLNTLRVLDLGDNGLLNVPNEIGRLRGLESLNLRNNGLTQLPDGIASLAKLKYLDLANNGLTNLPEGLSDLRLLERLDLRGNALSIPPEMLQHTDDPSSIVDYYFTHEHESRRSLNEAKILLVGQGSVGKTSLLKRLVHNAFAIDEPKTEGINIQAWAAEGSDNTPTIRLNLWDFGGQEIMHATHQFFLTRRSLYLLVLDSRNSDADNRLEYWLRIIQSFGGESPVVIVGNKIDQQPLDIDQTTLRAKYRQIKAVVEVSCQTGKGIPALRQTISRLVAELPHVNDKLPVSWFDIKTKMEQLEVDFMSHADYQQVCSDHGVSRRKSQDTLLRFLHDLGLVLNFKDDPRLEDTNILKPTWVTGGVYTILNSNELFHSRGVLQVDRLDTILDAARYPQRKHLFIIDVMRKFELCFDFEGQRDRKVLIPALLSRTEPYTGEWDDCLVFQYTYNVLPASVISRFIVRTHAYIHEGTVWRTGVMLAHVVALPASLEAKPQSAINFYAIVRANLEDRYIDIRVRGNPADDRRLLLEIIRSNMEAIHETIPGLQVQEKLSVAGEDGVVVDYQHLLTLRSMRIRMIVPEGSDRSVSVNDLLKQVETVEALKSRERARKERKRRREREPSDSLSPWRTGGFYLFVLLVVMISATVLAGYLHWALIPIVLVVTLLSVLLIGALQLRHDQRITDKSLVDISLSVLKQLPKFKVGKDA